MNGFNIIQSSASQPLPRCDCPSEVVSVLSVLTFKDIKRKDPEEDKKVADAKAKEAMKALKKPGK